MQLCALIHNYLCVLRNPLHVYYRTNSEGKLKEREYVLLMIKIFPGRYENFFVLTKIFINNISDTLFHLFIFIVGD
jgi:hypothetical protein